LIFFKSKEIIKYIFFSKAFVVSLLTISLLLIINISYTGCAVYPIKETCFDNKLSWSTDKKVVGHMSKWYQQWAKAGANATYRVENPDEYIKNFNWVSNWYERYFSYKGNELLIGIFVIFFIFFILFMGPNKEKPDKKSKKITITLFLLTILTVYTIR